MDPVDGFEIELDRDVYYPGDTIHAHAFISTVSNVKVRGMYSVTTHSPWLNHSMGALQFSGASH